MNKYIKTYIYILTETVPISKAKLYSYSAPCHQEMSFQLSPGIPKPGQETEIRSCLVVLQFRLKKSATFYHSFKSEDVSDLIGKNGKFIHTHSLTFHFSQNAIQMTETYL